MKIKVGELEVLDSGVVSTFNNEPISFELSHNGEDLNLTLNFAEQTNKNDKGDLIDSTEFHLSSGASITLKGWDNPLGVAFTAPVSLGTIGGRTLKLLLRCYGMQGQKNRMVSFTWLLGGEHNAS